LVGRSGILRRYLLTPWFLLLFGFNVVVLAFAMNVYTGGTLPAGWAWYEPWSVPVLVVSSALTITFPLWQYFHAKAEQEGLLSRRAVSRRELRRYRQALMERCSKVTLPFMLRPSPGLRDIYIPLRAIDEQGEGEQVDASAAIADHRSVLILGPPGSGKSMLLKQTALAQLEPSSVTGLRQQFPVLLELSRLNDPSSRLETTLAGQLRYLGGIQQPERMLQRALEGSHMLLLLDGLDEVASQQRPRIAQEIRDLLIAYPQCRVVITCRSAVYDQGLREDVDRAFKVADLSDDLIKRFLASWPGLRAGAADRLMRALQAAPKIMALARNPLLLTLMAYLYADEDAGVDRRLPRSRSDFYKEATDVLLYRWRQDQNRFTRPEKRAVLERLALSSQHRRSRDDSLEMPYSHVLSEVAEVLPPLNRERSEARAILDEIVEHSALLQTPDAGEHYQFAHLTMQEYFAASALYDDPAGLVGGYLSNPDAWREPLLLWCGDARDASEVIAQVYTADPIMALECLDSAQRVAPSLAQRIITDFEQRLIANDDASAVAIAFGAIAAGGTPRARAALEFLKGALDGRTAKDPQAVANAIAATGLPEAAEILATRFTHLPEVRPALVNMGDVAASVLSDLAARGNPDAFDCLQAIGTPTAAKALASLLWAGNADDERPYRAAWRLAVLLKNPSVEASLASYLVTSEQERSPYLPWLWLPFVDAGQPGPLTVVTGRVGYLLVKCPLTLMPAISPPIDPRISVALLTVDAGKNRYHSNCQFQLHVGDFKRIRQLERSQEYPSHNTTTWADGTKVRFSQIGAVLKRVKNHRAELAVVVEHVMRHFLTSRREAYLFATLPPELRVEVGRRMLSASRWASPAVWERSANKRRKPPSPRGTIGCSTLLLGLGAAAWTLFDLIPRLMPNTPTWGKAIVIVIMFCALVYGVIVTSNLADKGSVVAAIVRGIAIGIAGGSFIYMSNKMFGWVASADASITVLSVIGLMGILSGLGLLGGVASWTLTDPVSLAGLFGLDRHPAFPPESFPEHVIDHPVGHHKSSLR
jgi:energy-coupling factor transporter ATP-binding protein EcfA2